VPTREFADTIRPWTRKARRKSPVWRPWTPETYVATRVARVFNACSHRLKTGATLSAYGSLSSPMSESSFYHRLIAGETGVATFPLRALLRAAESVYALGVGRRNARFDRDSGVHRVPVPVISVGNITVGGTGKTPIVIDLLRRLRNRGLRPAVVSRGYGAGDGGENDEAKLVRRRFSDAILVCDADRVRGARTAIAKGANVIVLDDGFQHRRLARDLDIVAVDATRPFGYGHLLPRGLLREPVASLRRAGLIVLTRCDQVSDDSLAAIEAEVRRIAPDAPRLKCRHHVTGLERLDGASENIELRGKRVVLFAGIARPERFLDTVRSLGATVVGVHWWPDHYAYRDGDLTARLRQSDFPPFDFLVTTEKDAVKLTGLKDPADVPILVLRVDIDFQDGGDRMLQTILEQRLTQRPA